MNQYSSSRCRTHSRPVGGAPRNLLVQQRHGTTVLYLRTTQLAILSEQLSPLLYPRTSTPVHLHSPPPRLIVIHYRVQSVADSLPQSVKLASSTIASIPAALSSSLTSLYSSLPTSVPSLVSEIATTLHALYLFLPSSTQAHLESALRALPVSFDSPKAISTAFLTLLALLFVAMASWSRGFWPSGGRFSPFGASASAYPPQVTDDDYSYITADELSLPQQSYGPSRSAQTSPNPSSDDDIILLKLGGGVFPLHFPPYSIDDGILTVADLKGRAAEISGVGETRRIKLLYKGRTLKDDHRPVRDDGVKIDSEVLCIVSDDAEGALSCSARTDGADEDDGSDSDGDDPGVATGSTSGRRKRTRSKKKKSKKSGTSSGGPGTPYLAPPEGGASGGSRPTSRPASPAQPKAPVEKLNDISSHFHTQLLPQSIQFTTHPPNDTTKKEFEHKRLTETILSQVLLKLDAVETEGDVEARQRRKDLVKETQGVLNALDAVMKKQ